MNNSGAGGTRRDWEGHGASTNSYPSGPPDFTKPGGAPDFSRTTTSSSEAYSTSSGMNQQDNSQAFQSDQFSSEVRDQPTGLMGHVATATDTAKVAAMNALEGGKNLARQASESAWRRSQLT